MAIAMHGEPVAWKLARPVRREGRRNHLPRGRQALCSYSTFPVGPLHCDLDGGRETGDDRPCTRRAGTKWKGAGDGFFASRRKAEGGGKKLATDVAGDERGEAGLRSDPCQSRSRMERQFQEIGGIRQWRPSLHLDARERQRRGFRWSMLCRLTFIVMARQSPPVWHDRRSALFFAPSWH